MELMPIVADLLGAGGMFFFFFAEVLQLRKIKRKKTVRSLSYHTYKSKVAALVLTMSCFGLSGLVLSFIVLSAELVVVAYIIKLMRKYRGH